MTLPNDYRADAIKDEDAVGMALVGRATELLRAWHNADDSYNTAEKDDARNVSAHFWHARPRPPEVQHGERRGATCAPCSKLEPKNPDALVFMARIKLAQTIDFDTAECAHQGRARGEPEARRRARGPRGPRAPRHGHQDRRERDRRGVRGRSERPRPVEPQGRRALPRRRPPRLRGRAQGDAHAQQGVLGVLHDGRRVRRVGAPLRRHHRDDEGRGEGRPRRRPRLGAARSHGDAPRRRAGRPPRAEQGVLEGQVQRLRLQHARSLRVELRQRLRFDRRRSLQDSLFEEDRARPAPLRAAHAR